MTARKIGEARLVISGDSVEVRGMTWPLGNLEAVTEKAIAVRFRGSSEWSGRGQPRRYVGSEVVVFDVKKWQKDGAIVGVLLEVPVRGREEVQAKARAKFRKMCAEAES